MRILIFIILTLPFLSLTQEINWGGYTQYNGSTIEIIQNNEHFYTLRNKKQFIFNSIHISKFDGFNQVYSERIHKKIGGKSASIIGFELFNNKPIIILVNQFQNKKIVYFQRLNDKGLPAGPAEEIMQYNLPKSWFNKGEVSYSLSKNKKYILVNYQLEASKNQNKQLVYCVLDSTFKKVNQGNLSFEEKENSLYTYEMNLSNSGEVFLLRKINEVSEGLFNKNFYQITSLEFNNIKGDTINKIKINLQNNKFVDVKMNSNDQLISIVGLYTRDESTYKIDGTYYFNYDYKNHKIINEGITSFSTDFITQHWSERARKRAIEREVKGKESPALYDYYIKNVIPQKDSTLIFLMEQYYVSTISYTDPRTGYISTRYIYHYNDIIVGKVSSTNNIEWMQSIPKSQISENDGGYYSSFANYITNDKLIMFFNDGATLYDKMGMYKEKQDFVLFNKLKRVLAVVELDLKTGNYVRRNSNLITRRNEFAIPILFSNNSNSNTFVLFLRRGNKENFGILKY